MTFRDRTDEDLVKSARDGDDRAFGELVRRHQDKLFGFMMRITRDEATSEDLAQSAFLRAYRGLDSFIPSARFSPWLYRIGFNVAMDWDKDERRRRARSSEEEVESAPDPAPALDDRAVVQQEADAVRRRVFDLPADMQQAVILRHMMGLSYGEMATVTGWPLATVKTNLFRARARLKAFYEELTREPCTAKKC